MGEATEWQILRGSDLSRVSIPTSPAGLLKGQSHLRVRHCHCDDHTGVDSHPRQFDSRPKGEWLFVAVRRPQGAIFLAA